MPQQTPVLQERDRKSCSKSLAPPLRPQRSGSQSLSRATIVQERDHLACSNCCYPTCHPRCPACDLEGACDPGQLCDPSAQDFATLHQRSDKKTHRFALSRHLLL